MDLIGTGSLSNTNAREPQRNCVPGHRRLEFTPLFPVVGAMAEFERALIQERGVRFRVCRIAAG
jgi:hypothetical protein